MQQGISWRAGHPTRALWTSGSTARIASPSCTTGRLKSNEVLEMSRWRVVYNVHCPGRVALSFSVRCLLDSVKHDEDGQASAPPKPVLHHVSGSSQTVDSSLGKLFEKMESRKDCIDGLLKSRSVDVVTLGNLCVDIVLKVPQLPQPSSKAKSTFVQHLSASLPDETCWEAGGNSNVAIAAARLGMQCIALGHVGQENYGKFLHRVLEKEGVHLVGIHDGCPLGEGYEGDTLVCWVLVDPERRHEFCSRYDYNQTPVFNKLSRLPSLADDLFHRTRAIFCNGFVYDELSPLVVQDIIKQARDAGSAIFFDPGPRSKALAKGSLDQQQSLNRLLSMSDVILLTDDEAEALTGLSDPRSAAMALLEQNQHTKWVVVKLGARGCLMATTDGLCEVPGFKVDVKDTVGCGDSFAAAVVLGYTRGVSVSTTLALANAVGAATAMGCGAGRNVASSSTVFQILSELSIRDGEFQSASSQTELLTAAKAAAELLHKLLENNRLQ